MPKNIFKKTIEAPAELLEKTIEQTEKTSRKIKSSKVAKSTEKYWDTLGPGLTTGAADDDPSGIATYSQAGAQYGFHLLWLSFITYPLASAIQEMCARISLVTGRGLAANIRTHFSKKILFFLITLLFAANAFNIGADLGMMAETIRLINPDWNYLIIIVAITALLIAFQIFVPYKKYAKYLKWLALVLFAYIISAFLANINWLDVAKSTLSPSITFSKDQLLIICAIFGTTISPYLFFWQSSQEIEEEISSGQTNIALRQAPDDKKIKKMRIDVWSGMFFSNLVMFFIIATCGAILFPNGITTINTAAQAAEALRPFAGDTAYLLFAAGIVGVGMLSIPVLAGSSSYAIAETFKWREGLSKKLKSAYAFYGVIIISMLLGLCVNFIGLNPIKVLIYSAVANGIVAPLVLIPIVLISSNKKIMGKWSSKPISKILGWAVVIIMSASGIAAIISLFS